MRLLHEIAIFQTVKSKVIISLFETVRLSVSISLRNLYNSLNSINENSLSHGSKVKLVRSIFTSIFLSVCESWTFTGDSEEIMQALKMRCYLSLLNISYKDHVTIEEGRRKIQAAI